MSQENIPITEAINGFNALSLEIRSRIESLVKQVLIVSGGIQTITISAFLTGNELQLTEETLALLKCAWLQLSASIILCLVLMLFQIFGMIHIGIKHKNKLEKLTPGVQIMTAWLPLRVINWLVGLAAFFFCVSGVYTISKAAISLIGA